MDLLDGTQKSDQCITEFLKNVLQPQESEVEQVSSTFTSCLSLSARLEATNKLTFFRIRFINT
jgi:hypothetical protein